MKAFRVIITSLLCLLLAGVAEAQTEITNKPLPKEGLQLPQTLDYELEKLLQRWYEGYERRSIAPYASSQTMAVPNVHDSVYINMMNRIPSAIRLSYNSVVRESIELYLYRRRPLLSLMLSLSDLYFPDIEAELDRYRLPLELKYLTIVESALNPTAISPVGAAGLWQFMLPTARMYGLDVNSLVDERMDPIKGTEAACKMLRDLYKIYNDWWLVMAAYNCGAGNVNRAIKRAGGGTKTFWDIYPYLPRETRKYVPLYIGVYYAMHYANHYGIQARELGRPLATEYFEVKRNTTFNKIASLTGLSVEQIKAYNPQFRRGIVPWNHEPYQLRLPLKAVMTLEGYKPEEIQSSEMDVVREGTHLSDPSTNAKVYGNEDKKYIYHRVARRETVERIAKRYGVSVRDIRSWNGFGAKRGLRVGERIIVGVKIIKPKATAQPKPEAITPNEVNHSNSIQGNIAPNTEIGNPPTTSTHKAPEEKTNTNTPTRPINREGATVHRVQEGESLITIAMRYNTSVMKLRELNNLQRDVVRPGDEIIINEGVKQGATVQTPSTATSSTQTVLPVATATEQQKAEVKKGTSKDDPKINKPNKKEEQFKAKEKKDKRSKPKTHKIQKGETTYRIAQKYGVTVEQIRKWNKLRNDNLQIGQELRVSP